MFYQKSYVSGGFCSETYYKFGQVVNILSLLMTTSTLILLLITFCDVGRSHVKLKEGNADNGPDNTEEDILSVIKVFTLLYIVIQARY